MFVLQFFQMFKCGSSRGSWWIAAMFETPTVAMSSSRTPVTPPLARWRSRCRSSIERGRHGRVHDEIVILENSQVLEPGGVAIVATKALTAPKGKAKAKGRRPRRWCTRCFQTHVLEDVETEVRWPSSSSKSST